MKKTEEFENNIKQNDKLIEQDYADIKAAKALLNEIISQNNMSISQLGLTSGLGNYIYEVVNLKNEKVIGRNKLIALLITLKVDLITFDRILQMFSYSKIYARVEFDSIIYHAIDKKLSLDETNILLDKRGFPTI